MRVEVRVNCEERGKLFQENYNGNGDNVRGKTSDPTLRCHRSWVSTNSSSVRGRDPVLRRYSVENINLPRWCTVEVRTS